MYKGENKRGLEKSIAVYGRVDDGLPELERHDTTYYEVEIPVEIEEKLDEYRKKLEMEFYNTCKCESCTTKQ